MPDAPDDPDAGFCYRSFPVWHSEHSIPQLKGIQLDAASAGTEAILNLSKQIHLAPMQDLLRALH